MRNNQLIEHTRNAESIRLIKYDFEKQKQFIEQQKQWLNKLISTKHNQQQQTTHRNYQFTIQTNKSYHNLTQNRFYSNGYDEKVKYFDNKLNIIEQKKQKNGQNDRCDDKVVNQLEKTVKQHNVTGINSNQQAQHVHTLKRNNQQNNNNNIQQLNNVKSNFIMPIDAIRQLQKKITSSERKIHRINSSSSRNKLGTQNSKSKDSKNSINNQKIKQSKNKQNQEDKNIKKINLERYNKYLQNQLININIDLRRDVHENVGIKVPVRNLGSKVSNYQGYNGMTEQKLRKSIYQSNDREYESARFQRQHQKTPLKSIQNNNNFIEDNNQALTCRQSAYKQDRPLTFSRNSRSKSNLSKYSQMKSSKINDEGNDCLMNCEQQGGQQKRSLKKETVIEERIKTPQKQNKKVEQFQISRQTNSIKKIHSLSYSSNKKPTQSNQQPPLIMTSYSAVKSSKQPNQSKRQLSIIKNQKVQILNSENKKQQIRLTLNRKLMN